MLDSISGYFPSFRQERASTRILLFSTPAILVFGKVELTLGLWFRLLELNYGFISGEIGLTQVLLFKRIRLTYVLHIVH